MNITGNSGSRIVHRAIYSPLATPDPCNTSCISLGGNTGSMRLNDQVIGGTVDIHGNGTRINWPDVSDRSLAKPHLAD